MERRTTHRTEVQGLVEPLITPRRTARLNKMIEQDAGMGAEIVP